MRQRKRFAMVALLFAAGGVLGGARGVAAAPGVTAKIILEDPILELECPVNLTFFGSITVSDPEVKMVRYQFVRSDDVGLSPVNLAFPAPGTQEVSTTLPVPSDFIGWLGIRVLQPDLGIIGRVDMDIRCRNIPPGWNPTFQVNEDLFITEDLLSLGIDALKTEPFEGGWGLLQDGKALYSFATREEAEKALALLRHHKATHASPPAARFRYFLSGGRPPRGAFEGEESVAFDPDSISVRKVDDGWAIVSGGVPLFQFGRDEKDARRSLAIIRRYRFDHACRFSGQQGPYWYLRK